MTARGGCLCGAVRYTIDGEIGPAAYCHCCDCRRVTGSAFNVSAPVPIAAFDLTSGELGHHTKAADSGTLLTRYFCTGCGSPIYTASPRHPDVIYVKAGSFDDPAIVRPVRQAWTDSRVPWASISASLESFGKGSSAALDA